MDPKKFFGELRRRHVYRVVVAYAIAGWALIEGIAQVFPIFDVPNWVTRVIVMLIALGFPVALILAWVFDITPEGLKRTEDIDLAPATNIAAARKLNFVFLGVLTIAVIVLVTDRFVLHHGVDQTKDVAISEKSIAVLPFVNMSEDKSNDYFSDGISEELLNLLAKVPQLKVTARVSSFSFKGKNLDIREMARRLHVAHVLEGSVRKAGGQVRITAQLIHAADGFHVWSESYDRKLDDIFKIQDEVAGKVVKELKVTLLGPPPTARTTDPKAYALYLQARQLGRQFTAEPLEKSDALYRQVLEIDPHYAPAWNGLGWNLMIEINNGTVPSHEGLARVREFAQKALEIDPDYAPAHARLGSIAMYENDLAGAANHFERALMLDPTDLGVIGDASTFLMSLGRRDEALALDEAGVRRDPVNTTALYNFGLNLRCAGKYDDAINTFRTVLSLNPGQGTTHSMIAVALLLKGNAAGALSETEQETVEPYRMIGLPMVYYTLGRKADSDNALAALIAKYEKDASFNIASVYAFLGEADQAFAWLEKAVEYHDPGLSDLVSENLFDKIHSDSRWLPFLSKIGKAPDQLAKIQFKMPPLPQ